MKQIETNLTETSTQNPSESYQKNKNRIDKEKNDKNKSPENKEKKFIKNNLSVKLNKLK
jgi:hypothetical protein